MKEFPQTLNVSNKDIFPNIYYKRILCYLRKEVYEHVISNTENSYFDLEKFGNVYLSRYPTREGLISTMSVIIKKELENLGWKCKIAFHGTALFIYSTETPPPSCWDDTF